VLLLSIFLNGVMNIEKMHEEIIRQKCMYTSKECMFKTICWDENGETIEGMKLATEHRSNRLFDDLSNSMINNHIYY
jgi:hypothetical protein